MKEARVSHVSEETGCQAEEGQVPGGSGNSREASAAGEERAGREAGGQVADKGVGPLCPALRHFVHFIRMRWGSVGRDLS